MQVEIIEGIRQRINVNVHYSARKQARDYSAKWDNDMQTWYIIGDSNTLKWFHYKMFGKVQGELDLEDCLKSLNCSRYYLDMSDEQKLEKRQRKEQMIENLKNVVIPKQIAEMKELDKFESVNVKKPFIQKTQIDDLLDSF